MQASRAATIRPLTPAKILTLYKTSGYRYHSRHKQLLKPRLYAPLEVPMQQKLRHLIHDALKQLQKQQQIPTDLELPAIQIERTRNPQHGDFSCNIALVLAKTTKIAPRELATQIIAALASCEQVASVSQAGPGFINFSLQTASLQQIVHTFIQTHPDHAHRIYHANNNPKAKRRYLIEFVSANPTGPLHVGHGRSAAYGACVANLLRCVGHHVDCEYYVNDAGRQIRILGLSTWLRYLQIALPEHPITFPESGVYQGAYVKTCAETLYQCQDKRFTIGPQQLQQLSCDQSNPEKTQDQYIDQLINIATSLLGIAEFHWLCAYALEDILQDIQQDLGEFGVNFQDWFRESSLIDDGALARSLQSLTDHGYVYEQDGAKWFKASALGDEKDRVLIRANGQPTYFASDVAYHLHKYERNYTHLIDIFGADHHGYIARIKAFLKGLKRDPNKLDILLVQFAILYRGTEKVSMSTRSGEFVSLRTLREEVGNDAARFFYIMRKPEQHLDFDLELAKKQSNENPVYYIQYAHARICQVMRQAQLKNISLDQTAGLEALHLLDSEHESRVLTALNRYPELVQKAANQYAPHMLAHFLQELAAALHSYYNAQAFLVDNIALCQARLCLIEATRHVLQHGLNLLGISAPDRM